MRQGASLNISFEPQLIKSTNLINISKGNSFQESFEQFGGVRLSLRSFWTPGLCRKGPIKKDPSIHPSFCLSISLLRIGSLVFSEPEHGVRGPYLVMCDRAGFFGKNPYHTKMTENGQKWHILRKSRH